MMDIGVVVVTYNRLDKLKRALESYEVQDFLPKYILVVDNHSGDGTGEFLSSWKEKSSGYRKIVITLEQNTGGSGGFFAGLKMASVMDADWIWVSDDDAYLEKDAFLRIQEFLQTKNVDRISAICGKVVYNHQIDTWHRRRLKKKMGLYFEELVPEAEYSQPFHITYFSYVGTLMRKRALELCGLPEKDYFLAYDDSEHSYRLSKAGEIICVPEVSITHDTNEVETSIYSWKKYYMIRNKIYSYRKHFPLYQSGLLAVYYYLCAICDPVRRAIAGAAIKDAFCGKLGLHEKYKPGWKADREKS